MVSLEQDSRDTVPEPAVPEPASAESLFEMQMSSAPTPPNLPNQKPLEGPPDIASYNIWWEILMPAKVWLRCPGPYLVG